MSSVAAAGDFHGTFDETMFDEGQHLPSPYHRTKFESEQIVREEATVPWRVYRPSIVVGDSQTGAMDKVDGPYYFFPMMKVLRDRLPAWLPLVGVDLGDTNVVPVDYVAKAMDHLAHLPDRDGEAFHLVNPEPQPVVEMINLFCAAAGAPQFATPIDRSVTTAGPLALLPRAAAAALARSTRWSRSGAGAAAARPDRRPARRPGRGAGAHQLPRRRSTPGAPSRRWPAPASASPTWSRTPGRCGATGRSTSTPPPAATRGPARRSQGKYVVITGASSGIGQVTALKVAQAGGIPVLVARGKDKLEETRADDRGPRRHRRTSSPATSPTSRRSTRLCEQIAAELPSVDFVVNNAGRSIRRSLKLSQDRFHDFERTMQLNYFGAIRLVMGLLPAMQRAAARPRRQHLLDRRADQPAAVLGVRRLQGRARRVEQRGRLRARRRRDHVHQHPHAAGADADDRADQALRQVPHDLSPAQAADMVIEAMVERPHEINTLLGNAGAVAHTVAPKTAFRVLNMAYHVFPDSAAAKGDSAGRAPPAPASPSRSCWPGCSRACTGRVVPVRSGASPVSTGRGRSATHAVQLPG